MLMASKASTYVYVWNMQIVIIRENQSKSSARQMATVLEKSFGKASFWPPKTLQILVWM